MNEERTKDEKQTNIEKIATKTKKYHDSWGDR